MNILVTGANGFLGQHLVKYLSSKYSVIGVGRGNSRVPAEVSFSYHSVELTDETAVAMKRVPSKPCSLPSDGRRSAPTGCGGWPGHRGPESSTASSESELGYPANGQDPIP